MKKLLLAIVSLVMLFAFIVGASAAGGIPQCKYNNGQDVWKIINAGGGLGSLSFATQAECEAYLATALTLTATAAPTNTVLVTPDANPTITSTTLPTSTDSPTSTLEPTSTNTALPTIEATATGAPAESTPTLFPTSTSTAIPSETLAPSITPEANPTETVFVEITPTELATETPVVGEETSTPVVTITDTPPVIKNKNYLCVVAYEIFKFKKFKEAGYQILANHPWCAAYILDKYNFVVPAQ